VQHHSCLTRLPLMAAFFPYTTLFRSQDDLAVSGSDRADHLHHRSVHATGSSVAVVAGQLALLHLDLLGWGDVRGCPADHDGALVAADHSLSRRLRRISSDRFRTAAADSVLRP